MNSKKIFLMKFVIFILLFLVVNLSFGQAKKEEMIYFSGVITSISKDYKSIVVNHVNILIFSDTKIVNEKGTILKIDDLKSELFVGIEGSKNPNGIVAKKIVVKKPPEV